MLLLNDGMASDSAAMLASSCAVVVAPLELVDESHLALLDVNERRRRSDIVIESDRARFTLGAVLLRLVVARQLGVDAKTLAIDRTCDSCGASHGRPRLTACGLHASISHSGDLVAVALTAAGAVGIDIEQIMDRDVEALAAVACAPTERTAITSSSAFHTCWTRKEAVLKALACGLRTAPSDVVVSAAGRPPRVVTIEGRPPSGIQMFDLPVATGYAGALAVLSDEPISLTMCDPSVLLATGSARRRARARCCYGP